MCLTHWPIVRTDFSDVTLVIIYIPNENFILLINVTHDAIAKVANVVVNMDEKGPQNR